MSYTWLSHASCSRYNTIDQYVKHMLQPCKPLQTDTIGHTCGSVIQVTPNTDTLDQCHICGSAIQAIPGTATTGQMCGSAMQATSDTDTTGHVCGSARQASHIRHRYHRPACHTCSSTKQATPKYSYHRSNVWLSNASHSRYRYRRSVCHTGGLTMKATPDHNFKPSIQQKRCSKKEYIQFISQHMIDMTLLLNIGSQ